MWGLNHTVAFRGELHLGWPQWDLVCTDGHPHKVSWRLRVPGALDTSEHLENNQHWGFSRGKDSELCWEKQKETTECRRKEDVRKFSGFIIWVMVVSAVLVEVLFSNGLCTHTVTWLFELGKTTIKEELKYEVYFQSYHNTLLTK